MDAGHDEDRVAGPRRPHGRRVALVVTAQQRKIDCRGGPVATVRRQDQREQLAPQRVPSVVLGLDLLGQRHIAPVHHRRPTLVTSDRAT